MTESTIERLARIEESLERLEEKLDAHLGKHERAVFGWNGYPGLVMEVDRMKQDALRRGRAYNWAMGIISAVVAGLALKQVRG